MGPGLETTLTDNANRTVRLLRPLGKGGFGAVYLADVSAGDGLVQRMAVKVMHADLAIDPAMEARARDEAKVMSLLNHDHVVKIHALSEIGGRAAVFMEYIEGIDCEALMFAARDAGDGGLPLAVVGAIVEGAAAALNAALTTPSPLNGQPLNIVHRDIKPSNLLVSVSGVVKVLDFGVARGDYERESHTRAAHVAAQMGTRRYMSPERWLEQKCEAPADVYALGVSFWEMLTGEPFEPLPLLESRYAERLDQVLAALSTGEHAPAVHARLEQLIRQMLAWNAGARPTAAEVEVAVAELLDGVEGQSLRRYARDVVPELLATQYNRVAEDRGVRELTNSLMTPRPNATPPPAEPGERRPIAAIVAVFVLLAALSVGAWQLLSARQQPETPPVTPPAGGAAELPAGGAAELPAVLPAELPGTDPAPPKPGGEGPAPAPKSDGTLHQLQPDPEPPKPKPSQPKPPVPEPEPEPKPEPKPEPVPEPEPEPATPAGSAPPKVLVKLLSDPMTEHIFIGSAVYAAGQVVELAPGRYDVVFEVPSPRNPARSIEAACTVTVGPTTTRIKYTQSAKESERCTSY